MVYLKTVEFRSSLSRIESSLNLVIIRDTQSRPVNHSWDFLQHLEIYPTSSTMATVVKDEVELKRA